MSHTRTLSLAVPAPFKGHHHRRSAAVSLDWRHLTLPAADTVIVQAPASAPVIPAGSPTLTFASTVSDCSLGDAEVITSSAHASERSASPRKRVTFLDTITEIPPREYGDTWMKPEDYSWHVAPAEDSETIVLDALEPSIDLAPALTTTGVPGSPVVMHRKKRSSFLQSTKNVLSRRPSKKRPISPTQAVLGFTMPPPVAALIDLDVALPPDMPSLKHKKSGSLNALSTLPASPTKPKSWHRRADSAPIDVALTFSPRAASPESRKRKMSSIHELPHAVTTTKLAPSLDTTDFRSTPRSAGLETLIPDDMIFGEPGEMVFTHEATEASLAISALQQSSCLETSTKPKKGWKGMLHRLLH